MKREDLAALGLEKEAIDKVLDLHHADADPLKDKADQYEQEKARADKLKEDFDAQTKSIADLKAANGDADKLKEQIETLEQSAKDKDAEHQKALDNMQKKLDDTEFDKVLDGVIAKSGAKRTASVRAELDLSALRESKNREADMAEAVKALKEGEETSFLFGKEGPGGTGKHYDSSGKAGGSGGENADIAKARAVMGLSDDKKE